MYSQRPWWILQPPLLLLLATIGVWYAHEREIPMGIALALLPAFLFELALYFATATERVRSAIHRWPKEQIALGLAAAAVPSYLLYSIPLGLFEWISLLKLAGMAAAASFWFVLFGKRTTTDLGFMLVMAAPILLKSFEGIYPSPVERVPMQTLGIVMWYRTGIMAVLVLREFEGVGFGLMPRKTDWAIGVRNFGFFLPLGLILAYALEFVKPAAPAITAKLLTNAVLYFVGTLWFLAVAEEFFFRGLLQQTLARVLTNRTAGLLVASVLFGLVHLGFREFPNWRFALLATLAGIFYGLAYLQAASIRAAMVTHALVVTTWRVFLA